MALDELLGEGQNDFGDVGQSMFQNKGSVGWGRRDCTLGPKLRSGGD